LNAGVGNVDTELDMVLRQRTRSSSKSAGKHKDVDSLVDAEQQRDEGSIVCERMQRASHGAHVQQHSAHKQNTAAFRGFLAHKRKHSSI